MRLCWLDARIPGVAALVILTTLAEAGTIYKAVGPDGRTIYSDAPPAQGRAISRIASTELPTTAVPDAIARFREEMMRNADLRAQAEKAAQTSGLTLFTAPWCGYCRQAKAYLGKKGFAYRELDIETETGRQAFAVLGGNGGIPLLIRNGRQTRGFTREAYDAVFR